MFSYEESAFVFSCCKGKTAHKQPAQENVHEGCQTVSYIKRNMFCFVVLGEHANKAPDAAA